MSRFGFGLEILLAGFGAFSEGAGTCDIRFSLQGGYAREAALIEALRDSHITNTVVTVHGYALLAPSVVYDDERDIYVGGITKDDFIDTEVSSEDNICNALNRYLDHRMLDREPNHLIILDMEPSYPDPTDSAGPPISFFPSHLGEYLTRGDPRAVDDIIRAYNRRICVAREEVRRRMPTAKLGLFQVIVPDGKGVENDRFRQRMCGYKRAGELGMYDLLDYLVPVLYNRHGLHDAPRFPDGSYDLARLHSWIEQATRQALRETQQLTRRNGNTVPLAPFLNFWVSNGDSDDNNCAIKHETMHLQLQILQEYCAVEIIVMWSGSETTEEMRAAELEIINFNCFLRQVGELPPPGCT